MESNTRRASMIVVAVGVTALAAVSLRLLLPEHHGKTVGLLKNDPRAFSGYTLFAPLFSTTTYLIDMEGRVVNRWKSQLEPGQVAYLLENGNLLRAGSLAHKNRVFKAGGGTGGRVQEFTWDGDLVWDFEYSNDEHLLHHDVARLPNGNTLMIAWQRKTARESVAAGRNPELQGNGELWPDLVIEVHPTGKTGGAVVWQWSVWDHLIQDQDRTKANYGNVASHPERIDVNHCFGWTDRLSSQEVEKLRSLGYLGSSAGRKPKRGNPEWTHINAIAYNAALDQIALSVLGFNEIWIIDHSTTTEQAAGGSGGRGRSGGDLLYRWGNPLAYRAGTAADQRLFAQHNVQWIPPGLPGEGHLLLFNNGRHRPGGDYSSVDEISPPVDRHGHYVRSPGSAFGPGQPVWRYTAAEPEQFYSMHISGAQRLANGNTLVCSGANGTIFEVTPEKRIVWKYVNPIACRQRPRPLDSSPRGGNPADRKPPPDGQGEPPKQKDEPMNTVFRAYRYPRNYAGLKGKDLTPREKLEDLAAEPEPPRHEPSQK